MTVKFTLNTISVTVPRDKEDMPLLWFIREERNLKGTKYGCGIGQCGACTVHVNGTAARSCSLPVSSLNGMAVTTIEGLAKTGGELHPVQEAWMEIDVPQCGYCQPGQIMAAAALISEISEPDDEQIDSRINNICRCGSYVRIRKAVKQAAVLQRARRNRGVTNRG